MPGPNAPDLIGRSPDRRKLIAVVYADMVGYSRLIGLDDAGTLRRLRTLRRALIDPAIREYGGKVVQTAGDSLLVVFDSIDGAVHCAVKVQQQVPVYDGDQPPDRRIRFRVGINIGDVIAHGTDLHGDGVNIAARLEALCPVGGLCVSRSVYDHVRGGFNLPFEPIGPLTLKNIARPVEAFVLRLDPAAETLAPKVAQAEQPRARGHARIMFASIGTALLVVAGGAGWWLYRGAATVWPATEVSLQSSAMTQASTAPNIGIATAPRLSIVVLPFQNLSGDPKEDYLVEGITEDITTDLSRIQGMFVISRETAYTYRGKAIDVRKVGEELGVRYVLEGSVRKQDDVLRVTAQLISTETDAHLWADRFDVGRDGVGFDVDDIVWQIAFSLYGRLVDIESARGTRERPANPDAADLLLQARALYNRPPSPQRMPQIVALYERATKLDPSSVEALAGLAEALLDNLGAMVPSDNDPTAPVKFSRAEELITQAELLRPDDPTVMWVRVFLLGRQARWPALIPAAQKAIEANPNGTGAHLWLGIALINEGRAADAIPEIKAAIRILPRNPNIFNRYLQLGNSLILLGQYEEAIPWLQKSLAADPNLKGRYRGNIHATLAAAQALAGHGKEAHESAADASQLWPTLTVRGYFLYHIRNPVYLNQVARVRDGLRLAGIRDHADESADLGVAADEVLHTNYDDPTPTTVPGAHTIRTPDLAALMAQGRTLVLDTFPWGGSIPGAIALWGAGIGGSLSDEFQNRLRAKVQELTHGDLTQPIVAVGWNSERFDGRNLALRLVALGYTNVYWYRGGREAWEVAGLPETRVDAQDW